MDTPDSVCRARPLLGTFVEIRSAGATRAATERAIDAAFAVIDKIHRLMSFHDPDSDVGRLNREAWQRSVVVDPWTHRVLETALVLHPRSFGVFDIAVAPALQRLGCCHATMRIGKVTLRRQRATPSRCCPEIRFASIAAA